MQKETNTRGSTRPMSASGRRRRRWVALLVMATACVTLGAATPTALAQPGQEPVGAIRGRRLPLLPRRAARMEARGEILTVPLGQPPVSPRPAPPPAAPRQVQSGPRPGGAAQAPRSAAGSSAGPLAANLLEMARTALPGLLQGAAAPGAQGVQAQGVQGVQGGSGSATAPAPVTRDANVQPATRITPAAPAPTAPVAAEATRPDALSQGSLAAVAGDAARSLLVGRPEPFTRPWQDTYPQAWMPADTADWWRPATTAALAARLADAAAAPQVWTVDGQIVDKPPQADGTRSVLVDAAADQSTAGKGWLPLGVFATFPVDASALVDGEGPEPLGWHQLALGSDGSIRGNHYDAISDAVQPISGRVDPRTRLATWAIGGGRGARFEAPAAALTEPAADVQAVIAGAARPWTLVRLPKPAQVTVEGEPVELLPTPGR